MNQILYKRLARDLNRARVIPGKHKDILGTDQLDKVINIDQSPIGRTPRSNPATYTGVFDQIRDLFAMTKDAKAKGKKRDCQRKTERQKAGQSIARQYIIRQNGKARQTICKKAEYAYRAKADCKVKQIPHG